MRIIEERHIRDKEAVCTHCGTTLGYYPADIKLDKSNWIQIYIECPVCGHKIILDTFNLEGYWEWEKDFRKWKDGV